uniref:VLIG-type G domain-containing protein n=1 Tax=Leptobrachium leishanense TaxID=445787 RepID=A0A8C5QAL4_9ANUR
MASAAGALGTVTRMKWKLLDILGEAPDIVMDELLSVIPILQEMYLELNKVESKIEKTEKILNLITEKGEETCEEFLGHLLNMLPRFPELTSLQEDIPENKHNIFEEFLANLGMKDYITSKLKMKNILNIVKESLKDTDPQKIRDVPWHFLWKLMALNRNARSTYCNNDPPNQGSSVAIKDNNDLFEMFGITVANYDSPSLYPLDVVCALLHCSDHFLQQEIVSKMSMCQFAVPLLLPAGDGTHCTLMLWAMRDIVKRWRPHSLSDSKGFMEDNVVNVSMPTFSFVRLGKTKLSKSKILNQVLSQDQQHQDFFIHNDMEGGNIERKISNGLVEMSWYFPSGSKSSDIFSEPIAVTNLRGDLESNWNQFSFLTRVSSAVFIFTERIGEREIRILSNLDTSDTKYYLIISPNPGKEVTRETLQHLQKLMSFMNIEKNNIIFRQNTDNDTVLVKQIKSRILLNLNNHSKKTHSEEIKNLSKQANGLNIDVDEDFVECRKARKYAEEITSKIKDVSQYKKETMVLQRDLWKEISKKEKEMCRMRDQGAKETQAYRNELIERCRTLHEKQYAHTLPPGIMLFINAFVNLSHSEKHYFLKWIKFDLDLIARKNLMTLQAEYKEIINNPLMNSDELKLLDQKICDSSLGIEHFLREMGQFYEAERSMCRENQIEEVKRQYTKLPGMAADLLLDGFPLELIDGDASNIPLRWITDVLTELDTKIGGRCRMRVITVLGVQSTGKSTLLNTMFGLQFPVASGRCTRGAFMTLIRVEEDFIEELGCDFILVIDTEGLKAPELASLEDSYEHDNELATLVIGLSDITIINMAMENTAEMKDILQIVVHAFLRMKEIGKKPKCQFVHQNVSDVSAHEKNMRHREKLLEQLDEMTKTAAKMEKKIGIVKFSYVMEYDIEKDSWYIPGLWHGVPPMAPVNVGYSENVSELRKYMIDYMKECKSENKPISIKDFITWIDSLWNAVKHEKFIFSFRNSLVAQAYNKLSIRFSQWEWDFTKAVYSWMSDTETRIRNQSPDTLHTDTLTRYTNDLHKVLFEGEKKMTESLQKYFEDKVENVLLIEKYKQDFFMSVTFLKAELKRNAVNKCNEAFHIQKGKFQIQSMQKEYQKLISNQVIELLNSCRTRKQELNDRELEEEFEKMWKSTISELQIKPLQKHNISQTMLQQLRNNMSNKGPEINQRLLKVKCLDVYGKESFHVDKAHIDLSWSTFAKCNLFYITQNYQDKILDFAASLMRTCDIYLTEKVNTKSDYNDTHCQELLHMMDERLQDMNQKKLHFSLIFELEIKLLILGKASLRFQEMHETFIQENDPKICLEKLKPQYLQTFLSLFQEKDQSRHRAKQFCDLCLKPAVTEYIYKHLGRNMVDDILTSSDDIKFKSRTYFQDHVLKDLLEKEDCLSFVEYSASYEKYLRNWIKKYISEKYEKSAQLETLQKNILSDIVTKIQTALKSEKCLESLNIKNLLENLCEELKSHLVISQNLVDMVVLENNAEVSQFSGDIQIFLPETENQILSELKRLDIESVLSEVTVKPEDELLKKVIGCGKQCPFCKVPCEAGGSGHTEHFASIHRPKGLGRYHYSHTKHLCSDICSADIVSNSSFQNADTDWKYHPNKEYRTIYPDWAIQPDPSIESTDYWKYVFVKFNEQFAEEYKAKPAELPEEWREITKEQALRSLKEAYNSK